MRKNIDTLQAYRNRINNFFEDNRDLFQSTPIFQFKESPPGSEVYSFFTSSGKIYFKSRRGFDPYIEVKEMWKDDDRCSYQYKLVIPFVNFYYKCALSNKEGECNFEFRYEAHLEKNAFPQNHLHVLDGLPPHYEVLDRVDFFIFFDIIKRDFLKSGKFKFFDKK